MDIVDKVVIMLPIVLGVVWFWFFLMDLDIKERKAQKARKARIAKMKASNSARCRNLLKYMEQFK